MQLCQGAVELFVILGFLFCCILCHGVATWTTRTASAYGVQRRGCGGGKNGTIPPPILMALAQGPRVEESSGPLGGCERRFQTMRR